MRRLLALVLCMVLLTLCLSSCEKDPPIGAPYAREIKVTDGTVSVVPYEHFAFGQRRVQSGGWATVDGLFLDSILKDGSEALKNIPTLTKTENVSVELGENGELRHFDVYDLEYNLIEPSRKTIEDVNALSTGEWYIAVCVTWQGNYVPSAEKHETETYVHIFKLIVE